MGCVPAPCQCTVLSNAALHLTMHHVTCHTVLMLCPVLHRVSLACPVLTLCCPANCHCTLETNGGPLCEGHPVLKGFCGALQCKTKTATLVWTLHTHVNGGCQHFIGTGWLMSHCTKVGVPIAPIGTIEMSWHKKEPTIEPRLCVL